jgi:hypothetical protein
MISALCFILCTSCKEHKNKLKEVNRKLDDKAKISWKYVYRDSDDHGDDHDDHGGGDDKLQDMMRKCI